MVNKPSCHICFQEFIGECHNANAIVATLCAFLKLTEKLLRKYSLAEQTEQIQTVVHRVVLLEAVLAKKTQFWSATRLIPPVHDPVKMLCFAQTARAL